MNLSDLNNLPLSAIAAYCDGVLGLVFLLSALGVPLPSMLFVVAAGAFIQQGVLNLYPTIGLSLACVVLGDMLSYGMGRVLSRSMYARYGQSATWQRAEEYFARRGGIAIVLTRCVLTPIAVPVNLVAGSSAYPVWRFAAYAVSGEVVLGEDGTATRTMQYAVPGDPSPGPVVARGTYVRWDGMVTFALVFDGDPGANIWRPSARLVGGRLTVRYPHPADGETVEVFVHR